MRKLRCIEVGDGYDLFFTLNKKYCTFPHRVAECTSVLVEDNDGDLWLTEEDGLKIIEINFVNSILLIARFEVVE
jgi:hypothetical protein